MIKMVTKYTYNYNDHRYHPVGPSCTVPDDSYTIKELIQRFNSGCPADVHKYNDFDINPIENGTRDDIFRDVELVDPRLEPNFDLVDRAAAAEAARASSEAILARLAGTLQDKSDISSHSAEGKEKEDVIKEQT